MRNRIFADKLHVAVIVVFIKTHNSRRQRQSEVAGFGILQHVNHVRMNLFEFCRGIIIEIKRGTHIRFFFISNVVFLKQTDLFGLLILNIGFQRQIVKMIAA